MWNPVKIIIHNFLSHPDSEFNFPKDRLTMIFGKNEDDNKEGANSNGSGKSVLIEAVTVALTGATYRDINKEDFLLDGKDDGFVDFYLINSFNKNTLRILWEFERNKSSKVRIFENDSPDYLKKITTVNEAKQYILDTIGISREDLLNFFIINQGNTNSFFTAGDVKQKEIIGRFANYSIVDKVIKIVTAEKVKVESEITALNSQIESQNSIIQSYEELITEEKENIDDESREIIETLELDKNLAIKEKDGLVLLLPKKTIQLKELKEKLTLDKTEEKELIDLIKEIDLVRDQNNTLIKSKKKLDLNLSNLKASIEHAITCPACDHKFLLDSEKSIDELIIERKKVEKQIEELAIDIAANDEVLFGSEIHDDSLETIKTTIKKTNRSITAVEEEIEDNERTTKRISKNIESIDKQIIELREVKEKVSNIPTYKEKINLATNKLVILNDELDSKTEILGDKDYWLLHLGKKGFQTYLANKCINTIQNICNSYLQEMKVNLRIKINGYKLTAAGELRDKIEIMIIKDDSVEAKFNRFSGGQKERINLAGILTFHSLINNSLNGKGLNLLCLDESLDYLDEKGQKVCLNILQEFDLTTFVISHNPVGNIIEDYDKILVRYSGGVSKIDDGK